MSRLPILVILGATGSGKSKLGIELARRFNGEIISADSMQVYKGLDIITAKVTKEEQSQARHHMIDIVDPLTEFTVCEFKNKALPIMSNLLNKNLMPIIVGGTNYYIESLIWEILIADKESFSDDDYENFEGEKYLKKVRLLNELTNFELYKKLQIIDPEMSSKLHPNNRRKIIRSIEIYEQHGIRHSEILKQQRQEGGSGLGGPLRNENSVFLWLTCNQVILDERLDKRVDKMIETGLIKELLEFHERYNEERIQKNEIADYTKGIFQSIGFKEFHDYLILPKQERDSEKGQKLFEEGVNNLKIATKRYSRKQGKWIMNRLVRRADRQVPPLYTIDCTDPEKWESEVYEKAVEIISAVMNGESPSVKPINHVIIDAKHTDSSNELSYYCETCERVFIGDLQWNAHMNSMKHQKVLNKMKRLQIEEEEKLINEQLEKRKSTDTC